MLGVFINIYIKYKKYMNVYNYFEYNGCFIIMCMESNGNVEGSY